MAKKKTATPRFEVGGMYKLKYTRSGIEITGDFELIRANGGKYYLFSQSRGIDLFMDKVELINALQK
jgi:hypothetical protein